jgi:hypothetical protein
MVPPYLVSRFKCLLSCSIELTRFLGVERFGFRIQAKQRIARHCDPAVQQRLPPPSSSCRHTSHHSADRRRGRTPCSSRKDESVIPSGPEAPGTGAGTGDLKQGVRSAIAGADPGRILAAAIHAVGVAAATVCVQRQSQITQLWYGRCGRAPLCCPALVGFGCLSR